MEKQSQLILKPTDVELGWQVGAEFKNHLNLLHDSCAGGSGCATQRSCCGEVNQFHIEVIC